MSTALKQDLVSSDLASSEKPRFTYSDYLTWDDKTRWELIDGVPYAMAAPSVTHQEIVLELAVQFKSFLRGRQCRVIIAPFDVRLYTATIDNTIVQPDLLVVCDPSKTEDGKSCKGAPDLVVEVLSPSTGKHDQVAKFRLYQKAGVREYWIVDPGLKTIAVYVFEPENLSMRYYDDTESIPVHVLEGCNIDLVPVFESIQSEGDKSDLPESPVPSSPE